MSYRQQQRANEIILLNNEGARFIQSGDIDSAIEILADALNAVKLFSRTVDKKHRQQNLELSDWLTQCMEATKKNNTAQPTSSDEVDSSSSSQPLGYVYRSPIALPTNDLTATFVNVQCVTIMFNLALAFHLRGIQKNENTVEEQEWALQNAVSMYELCYEMMGTELINPGLFFMMTITNNLGHAHATLHIYDKAQKCFEHLLSMQMYLMDSIDNKDEVMADEQPFEGFMQNTSLLILSDCCASAA